jgi:hypothetical protein
VQFEERDALIARSLNLRQAFIHHGPACAEKRVLINVFMMFIADSYNLARHSRNFAFPDVGICDKHF